MTLEEILSELRTAFNEQIEDRQVYQWAQIYYEDCVRRESADCPSIENLIEGLKKQVPIQYLVNNARFYNLDLYVDERVLIPRPETEELVFHVNDMLPGTPVLNLLDIGTGSGCIPLLLKKLNPGWRISACDISEDALEVARFNAEKNELDVEFFQVDILTADTGPDTTIKYDVITSNPPYIPLAELSDLMPEVLHHEPHLALGVEDETPWLFYDVIARFGLDNLAIDGHIFCELHPKYAVQSAECFSDYNQVRILKDMQGRDRFLVAQL